MAPATPAFLLAFFLLPLSGACDEDISLLAGFPLTELLAQLKAMENSNSSTGGEIVAMPLLAPSQQSETPFKDLHRYPSRKTFHEDDYSEEKATAYKKNDKNKIHDLLNTSISALSYLAFGGYLLCMIVSALREKRRRIMMAYPAAGGVSATNTHFSNFQVLQHLMHGHRPGRPFIRFPAVTLHQRGKKWRRRSREGTAREHNRLR